MREVIKAKAEDAKMVVEIRGGYLALIEFETSDPDYSEFMEGVAIYDANQARGIIKAIKKVAKQLNWEV